VLPVVTVIVAPPAVASGAGVGVVVGSAERVTAAEPDDSVSIHDRR
jgi:hypothetical protein